MPYSGPDDKSLPSNVKKLSSKQRRQWVHVFNSAHKSCLAKGGKNCEAFAFKNANGVMMKGSTYAAMLGGEDALGRAFIELEGAEPPETINVFPAPGVYKHPLWGDVEVTEEGNEKFVEHFNDQIYQEHVPIDAEHETKLSGAVGYIKKLTTNADGSIEAEVEWTERGRKLIEDDSFKYVSPEWYETWKDPATGDEYENVLIGAALTTRPFFKGLRSLVASEGRWYDVDSDERTPLIKSTVEGISYNDVQSMVMSAARHKFPGIFGSQAGGGWLVDLWDDYAVISSGDCYYRVDFSFEGEEVTFSGQPREVQRRTVWEDSPHQGRDFSPEKREELASKGYAMPDGSYPIVTVGDLKNAIKAVGRSKAKEVVKRHITKRARALGRTDLLPEDWKGSTKDKAAKEDQMTVNVDELEIDKLPKKDQTTLFQRLASSLKATVKFGHDPEPGKNGDGDEDDTEEPKPEPKPEGEEPKPAEGATMTAAEGVALRTALASEKKAREAAEKRLTGLEQERQTQRFRDVILGRDEDSVRQAQESSVALHPMVGDHAAKLQIMRALAETKGEDSAEFKAYIASEREHASQIHQSGLFGERGVDSTGEPAGGSVVKEMKSRIEALLATGMKEDEAIAKIATEDKSLYDRYDKEISGRRGGYVGTGS